MSLMSLIYTHPCGGELWQGGKRDIWTAEAQGIRVVVLAAEELQPASLPGSPLILRARLRDSGSMEPGELAMTKSEASKLADAVAAFVKTRVKVLSSCGHGFNRSGLVTALALVKLGLTPDEAIETVRRKRHEQYGLCNDLFCRIIKGQA